MTIESVAVLRSRRKKESVIYRNPARWLEISQSIWPQSNVRDPLRDVRKVKPVEIKLWEDLPHASIPTNSVNKILQDQFTNASSWATGIIIENEIEACRRKRNGREEGEKMIRKSGANGRTVRVFKRRRMNYEEKTEKGRKNLRSV